MIHVWDTHTRKESREPLRGHTAGLLSLAIASEGNLIVSGLADHTVRVWDIQAGEVCQPFEGHTNWVQCGPL
jgi:WD40 repeat protein